MTSNDWLLITILAAIVLVWFFVLPRMRVGARSPRQVPDGNSPE